MLYFSLVVCTIERFYNDIELLNLYYGSFYMLSSWSILTQMKNPGREFEGIVNSRIERQHRTGNINYYGIFTEPTYDLLGDFQKYLNQLVSACRPKKADSTFQSKIFNYLIPKRSREFKVAMKCGMRIEESFADLLYRVKNEHQGGEKTTCFVLCNYLYAPGDKHASKVEDLIVIFICGDEERFWMKFYTFELGNQYFITGFKRFCEKFSSE